MSTFTLGVPSTAQLAEVVRTLASWQSEGAAFQLHPGDVGWYRARGPEATARALRIWSFGGRLAAMGLLDGPEVFRLTTAPHSRRDNDLAEQLAADLTDPRRGVLPPGPAAVEAPVDAVLHDALQAAGWGWGEAWTPLRHDFANLGGDTPLRVEIIGPDTAAAWAQTHRGAFHGSRFGEQQWRRMAAGCASGQVRSLLGHTGVGPVAAVIVWSAGPGRPGLIEPMGVPVEHRGHGYGRAICVAAAAALQSMGASSAVVATPSANVGGVATYAAAGYRHLPERRDQARPTAPTVVSTATAGAAD